MKFHGAYPLKSLFWIIFLLLKVKLFACCFCSKFFIHSTLIDSELCIALLSGIEGGPSTIVAVSKMVQNRVFQNLVDFDNHLDDIQVDWTNPEINRAIDMLAATKWFLY